MLRASLVLGLLGVGIYSVSAGAQTSSSLPPPEDFVDALQSVFNVPKGLRPSQAKGLCAEGTFTATPEAAALSIAPLFSGQPVPATVRLSVAGASLKASDKARTTRGMAIHFELPRGEAADLVMISAPVFFVRDPANFIPFVEARRADPATGKPDPAKVQAFNEAHPETKPQAEFLKTAPVPASYAQAPFWAVNTFYFVDKNGQRQPARWVVEPVAGVVGLTEEQMQTMPDDFLADEFRTRLTRGPAEWDFFLQFPEASDPLNDATVQWPADRRRVKVGRLSVTAASAAGTPGPCEAMMFDPLRLPKGIEPSEDPILLIRSPDYAVSHSRRVAP